MLAGPASAQYNVSGVVEFSYRSYETKTGDAKYSSSQFSQNYRANISSFVLDPRLLLFDAGIGYMIVSPTNAPDYDLLNYNLNLHFFTGMKVSWDLYGSQTVNNVQSNDNIAGYEVTSTSYGGTLHINPNLASKNGRRNNYNNRSNYNSNSNSNNNNGNNYNNGNRGWRYMSLPELTLSRVHWSSESQNQQFPLNEERDNTKASIYYRYNSRFYVTLDQELEKYDNKITNQRYDTTTTYLKSNVILSPFSNLDIQGNRTYREVTGFAAYSPNETNTSVTVTLMVAERNRLAQMYRYHYALAERFSGPIGSTYLLNAAVGELTYRYTDEVSLLGAFGYKNAESKETLSATAPERRVNISDGGLSGGVNYVKLYMPAFLGPFGFNTGYAFKTGFSNLSTNDPAQQSGTGWFYGNSLTAGIRSVAWRDETASLEYGFANRRDRSPVGQDYLDQSITLSMMTRRVPKTNLSAALVYRVHEASTNALIGPLVQQQNATSEGRSINYNIVAAYMPTAYLQFTAGANRGETTTTSTYQSLSNLPPSMSYMQSGLTLLYALADLNYHFTRNFGVYAQVREDYTYNKTTDTNRTRGHELRMGASYRYHMIFLYWDSQWRINDPDQGIRSHQTYHLLRLSRPF